MQFTMPAELLNLKSEKRNGRVNSVLKEDLPIHDWYRFVLSFPPHLVRRYVKTFSVQKRSLLLDPFCGTGTTLVEAKKNSIPSVGCDAHPVATLVSRVKTNWAINAVELGKKLRKILTVSDRRGAEQGLEPISFAAQLFGDDSEHRPPVRLSEEEEKLLPTGFLSQRPLKRLLVLRDIIEEETEATNQDVQEFFQVALAHVIANGAGNFAFGPEIYRTKAKPDYDVIGHFARQCKLMITELISMQKMGLQTVPSKVMADDARTMDCVPDKISFVITSPPYPNEKDYTRTTRVEAILLKLVSTRDSLRQVKEGMLRSNTRNIFVDDDDGEEVREFKSIQRICHEIERRRVELGKDSGFERLYHKVVSHYFGGMRRHLRALNPKLKNGAKLAYVVGDQLSFLLVPVATARLLGEIAQAEGYRIIGCDLWRERIGTKVRNSSENEKTVRVREEILLLEKR